MKTDRDPRVRFTQGNTGGPGNPHAGQVSQLRAAILEAVSAEDVAAIIEQLIHKARKGDLAASREIRIEQWASLSRATSSNASRPWRRLQRRWKRWGLGAIMNLERRLRELEQSLSPFGTDAGGPCDACGAPSTLVRRGLWFVDESDERACEGCGRRLDPDTGRPMIVKTIVKFTVAIPPPGWVHREYCPSANGED